MRIYPLFVNQYYGAVMERCRAISKLCSQTEDRIGAMNAAGADPDSVRLVTLSVQEIDHRREFFEEVRRLADLDRTSLVRRQSVDDSDDLLSAMFSAVIGGGAGGWDESASVGAVVGGMKEVAGAVSGRQAEQYGIGDQVARVSEAAARLQGELKAFQSERARLASSLQSRYPGQDWGMMQPVGRAPEK